MLTLSELTSRTGLDVLDHLETEVTIPVVDGLQSQGDLLIVPLSEVTAVRLNVDAEWRPVPPAGVEVLRGAAMGNPHILVADPGVCWWTTDVSDREALAIGVLDAFAPAYLLHREHGAAGVAPGRFVIRRQREQADVQRLVED